MNAYDYYDWQRQPSGLLIARDFWGEMAHTNVTSEPAAVLTVEAWAAFLTQWQQAMQPPLPDLTREVEAEAPFLRLPVEKLPEEAW